MEGQIRGSTFEEVVALFKESGDDGFWYLAQPYSSISELLMNMRFEAGVFAKASFMQEGIYVYSPIAENHPAAIRYELPRNWAFWKHFDNLMVGASVGIIVLMLPGWKESKGVREEINIASDQNKPVIYYNPYA